MLEYDRLDSIMSYLRKHQTATVKTLSSLLYASEATVRRDLTRLEKQGLLRRLHGGAVLTDTAQMELPLYLREQQHVKEKKEIASRAASLVRDGMVIFLDASSTAMFLVPWFEHHKNLTVITNGQKTSQLLSRLDHRAYCTGGLMLHNSSAYVGPFAEESVRRFNADIFFFSSRGLTHDGLITDSSCEENQVRKVMLENSREHIFLCDSSKLGSRYCYNLCHTDELDAWYTDSET